MLEQIKSVGGETLLPLSAAALSALGVRVGAHVKLTLLEQSLVIQAVEDTEFLQTFQSVLAQRRNAYRKLATSDRAVNTPLVDPLVQAVRAPSKQERAPLEEKLSYKNEPDLYSSEPTEGEIRMSPLVKRILQVIQDLPEEDQQQVIDFAAFLIEKHKKLMSTETDAVSQ